MSNAWNKELRELLSGRKFIQWPIATPDQLPAPLIAGDAGRAVFEVYARHRDEDARYTVIGAAEIELQVGHVGPGTLSSVGASRRATTGVGSRCRQ
jgi:hypothetical protein